MQKKKEVQWWLDYTCGNFVYEFERSIKRKGVYDLFRATDDSCVNYYHGQIVAILRVIYDGCDDSIFDKVRLYVFLKLGGDLTKTKLGEVK